MEKLLLRGIINLFGCVGATTKWIKYLRLRRMMRGVTGGSGTVGTPGILEFRIPGIDLPVRIFIILGKYRNPDVRLRTVRSKEKKLLAVRMPSSARECCLVPGLTEDMMGIGTVRFVLVGKGSLYSVLSHRYGPYGLVASRS